MRRTSVFLTLASVLVVGTVWAAGCGGDGDSVFPNAADAGSNGDDGGNAGDDASFNLDGVSFGEGGDGSLGDCDSGCAQGARCKYGVCIANLGTCTTNDDCPGDSYCDTDNTCVPYGVPPDKKNDPSCARPIDPGGVVPTVQCEWTGSATLPDGGADPAATYVNVYTTPVVADLNLDLDPNKLQPSVVITTWDTVGGERIGMLRVFDGRDCTEQMRIGGPDDPDSDNDRPGYGTQWAIGDLDGDVGTANGHPEIVGLHRPPAAFGTNPKLQAIAYAVDTSGGANNAKLVRKWIGRICSADGGADTPFTFATNDNQANYGPGIWDLDDDGKPEVVVDSYVFDHNGCLLNPGATDIHYVDHGVLSTVADVDLDGKPDLVRGDGIYDWDVIAKAWTLKSYFTQTVDNRQGHVAVANLGAYSVIPGKLATDPLPEIIVASADPGPSNNYPFNPSSTGTIRVQTLTGEIVFGPVPLFHFAQAFGGHGGPPTAADFDGDGQVEFAAAANEFYTVYDPDCVPDSLPDGGLAVRPGGKCMRPSFMTQYATGAAFDAGATPLAGILWAQPSSDFSSSETGSSIFDFNGDGRAEAVYRDECYLRVYDGATGQVIFSASGSSGTGQEEPVICDVDGDFATEIVVARATNAPNVGNNPGQCHATDILYDGGAFDAGADAGNADMYVKQGGFEVLRDPLDRWAASRPIWNQHAYSVTHVGDDGTIPRSSQMQRNWEVLGLNNFRQNTQGNLGRLALADLTATLGNLQGLCSGQSGNINLQTHVCNRGTNPVQDGVTISFYATQGLDGGAFDAAAGQLICSGTTPTLLKVGDCTDVSCNGFLPANDDVYVVVDPDGKVADCHPGNNHGASARVLCPAIPR